MILSVGTNWDVTLLDNIKDYPVQSVYTKLGTDLVGGGRPAYLLPKVTREEAAHYIDEVHKRGMEFTYLLNASCLGNREYTRAFQKSLEELLEWISEAKVDNVTISIPYVVQLIKKRYPHLNINISVLAHVDSLQRAKFFEDLGADVLTIPDMYNRDFKLLTQLKKHLHCEIQLIANLTCLRGCPFQLYHGTLSSHASQVDDELKGYHIDYCLLNCIREKFNHPVELIKSAWIRPEDLQVYEEMGIDSFKLVERFETTETITRTVKAYAERSYDGNLADIISAKTNPKRQLPPHVETFLRPDLVDSSQLSDMEDTIFVADQYIDNRALDGFLEFFKTKDCRTSSCEECGYCEEIAKKAIRISDAQKALKKIDKKLDALISGSIFQKVNYEGDKELQFRWDTAAKQKFLQIITDIPQEFQSVAQKAVSMRAEQLAHTRGSSVIEQQDMVEALLSETPKSFQNDLLKSLQEIGIHVDAMHDNV